MKNKITQYIDLGELKQLIDIIINSINSYELRYSQRYTNNATHTAVDTRVNYFKIKTHRGLIN